MARKGHFFITGWPRSRTAWLANFFTYGGSWCWHEGTNQCQDGDYFGMLQEASFDYVGDSNSGLYSLVDSIAENFPEAKWLLVDRSRRDAEAAYAAHFAKNPDPRYSVQAATEAFDAAESGLRRLSELAGTCLMIVKYGDIDTRIHEIWKWLVPAEPFNEERYQMLSALRINQIPERIPQWA
jgi:hypothetical protein